MLLHLLLIFFFTFIFFDRKAIIENKSPELYIPSYIYKPIQTSSMAYQQKSASQQQLDDKNNNKLGDLSTNKTQQNQDAQTNEANVIPLEKSEFKNTDPVHLIGDKKIDQPLIKLLGKAIYKRLIYPKIAVDFHLQGVASIGFLVHPDGVISDVSVVHSSGTEVLDNAAVSAIEQMSPVKNVDQYLQEPRYLVANIIFR